MIATQPITHIRVDSKGVAWIDDTNVKVVEVAVDKLSRNSTPEEMQKEYLHLSLAQIYAALAYYHDYEKLFDAQIERDLHDVSALREAVVSPPKADQLRALKRRS